MKLYEYPSEYDRIAEEHTDEYGCLTEEGERLISELFVNREKHIESLCAWIKSMRAESSAIKIEEDKLTERRKRLEKKCELIENMIHNCIEEGEKFSFPTSVISWRKSTAIEVTTDPRNLAPEFRNEITSVKPDKDALKQALARGMTIPGVEIVTRNNMRIQ